MGSQSPWGELRKPGEKDGESRKTWTAYASSLVTRSALPLGQSVSVFHHFRSISSPLPRF